MTGGTLLRSRSKVNYCLSMDQRNFSTWLAVPVSLNPFGQHWKRDVVSAAPGSAEFADHTHRAVSVASVDQDRRGALELRIGTEPRSDRIAGAFVVGGFRVVVFGVEIVIEKNRVVGTGAQQLLRFPDVACDVDEVAFEARRKPAMPSFIVIQQKDTNRMPLRAR